MVRPLKTHIYLSPLIEKKKKRNEQVIRQNTVKKQDLIRAVLILCNVIINCAASLKSHIKPSVIILFHYSKKNIYIYIVNGHLVNSHLFGHFNASKGAEII